MIARRRRSRPVQLLETLETRTLFSTSYAVLSLQAPTLPALPVQTDIAATPSPAHTGSAFDSALDAQVRVVPGGIVISVAASSTELRPEAPTGTVDIYEGLKYLTTVQLGGTQRSAVVLPAGTHTILVTYKGDENFRPSQTAVLARLTEPTQTPVTESEAAAYAKNRSGQRIRPMRFLSRVNYFDAQNMSAGNPMAAAIPTPGNVVETPSANQMPAPIAIPAPRFANVSFAVKLPKVRGLR
jgi:hypothetical protein